MPGRRESNKAEKQARIREAARALFTQHDFTATTMRSIAQRAHVGLGTLFSYADDKRDLVFLVFNEELASLTERALAAPRASMPVLEQLMALFGPHYRQFAREPVLARLALQELTFYSAGKQALAFQSIRERLMRGLVALIDRAQRSGHLPRHPSATLIARHVFFVYAGALRAWIAREKPGAAAGLRELRSLLTITLTGLAPD